MKTFYLILFFLVILMACSSKEVSVESEPGSTDDESSKAGKETFNGEKLEKEYNKWLNPIKKSTWLISASSRTGSFIDLYIFSSASKLGNVLEYPRDTDSTLLDIFVIPKRSILGLNYNKNSREAVVFEISWPEAYTKEILKIKQKTSSGSILASKDKKVIVALLKTYDNKKNLFVSNNQGEIIKNIPLNSDCDYSLSKKQVFSEIFYYSEICTRGNGDTESSIYEVSLLRDYRSAPVKIYSKMNLVFSNFFYDEIKQERFFITKDLESHKSFYVFVEEEWDSINKYELPAAFNKIFDMTNPFSNNSVFFLGILNGSLTIAQINLDSGIIERERTISWKPQNALRNNNKLFDPCLTYLPNSNTLLLPKRNDSFNSIYRTDYKFSSFEALIDPVFWQPMNCAIDTGIPVINEDIL